MAGKPKNLLDMGIRINDWVVISTPFKKKTEYYQKFRCLCGHEQNISVSKLKGISKCCRKCVCQSRVKSLIGKRYGRLLVIKRGINDNSNHTRWECQCDCGNIVIVGRSGLTSGTTKSCGCLLREKLEKGMRLNHGLACHENRHPLYSRYNNMIDRCYNPKNSNYSNYGARGITVCEDWLGENGLQNYINDLYPTYKNGLTLDRIDNNKGYFKNNVRWATIKQQNRNSSNCKILEIDGNRGTIGELCEIYQINVGCVRGRLDRGWALKDALTRQSNESCNWRKKNV